MNKSLLLCLTLLLSFVYMGVFAQSRTVSGVVTDENGDPIPGVTVVVKGTTQGTATDINGRYSLNVPEGATLVFSGVGLSPQEIVVGNQTTISPTINPDVKSLTEVVVVGYGTMDKRDLTGSVSTVKGAEIATLPVQSFEQALAGRATGVNVTMPNGVLNNPPIIRVRGTNSITSGSSPLIVVDGLPIVSGQASQIGFTVNNPLGDINPSDIESLEVLKDAASSAIYGSRAANGVILITTKKGKTGRPQVKYDTWIGITEAFRRFDLLNAEQFVTIKNEGAVNAGRAPYTALGIDSVRGGFVNTNWYDEVYRQGIQHSHHLSISGATEQTRYYFGVGYTDQEGMLKANNFRRTTLRANISHKVNNWLTIGANLGYTSSFNQSPNTGSRGAFATGGLGRAPLVLPPNVPARFSNGAYNIEAGNRIGRYANTPAMGNWFNPLVDLELSKFTSENQRIIANGYLEVKIVDGLKIGTYYGIDALSVEDIDFRNRIHGEGAANNGTATNAYTRNYTWNWQNLATFDKTFGDHSLNIVAGMETQRTTLDVWGGARQNLTDGFFVTYQGNFIQNTPPPALQTENGFVSFLSRANYRFKERYLFSASLRRDGFSALSANNKYGNFGGVSAGWRISEEGFFKDANALSFVNEFKVRASWGRVGNVAIPNFASLNLYNAGLYGDLSTWFFSQVGNDNLRWESSTKLDVGFDAAFFNNRIDVSFAYYNNVIDQLIINNPQAPSRGIPNNAIAQNIGKMQNTGIELAISSVNINRNGFMWTSTFNLTTNRNEVLALNEQNSDITSNTGGLELTNITRVGQPIGSIYAVPWVGVNPANGQAMFRNAQGRIVQYNHAAPPASRWTFVDDGGVASSPAGDRIVAGNTNPRWFGGLNNTLTYKGFDFNIFLQYSGGNFIYNGTRAGLLDQRTWNNSTEALQRWTSPGQNTTVPRLVQDDNISNGSAFAITRNVEVGDFLRVRNIALGYTFKQNFIQRAGLSSLRMYAQVQNAFLFTDYTGADPEVSTNGDSNLAPGIDRNSTPQARTYTFGLNVTF